MLSIARADEATRVIRRLERIEGVAAVVVDDFTKSAIWLHIRLDFAKSHTSATRRDLVQFRVKLRTVMAAIRQEMRYELHTVTTRPRPVYEWSEAAGKKLNVGYDRVAVVVRLDV